MSREFFNNGFSNQDVVNWTVIPKLSNLTSQCGAVSIFGGFNLFGNGASISKIFSNLPPHWSIQISFLFMKIDSWSDSYVYVYFDNVLFSQKKPFIDSRASLFSEFKDTLKKGGRFTGCFVICQYNSETQDWDFIDLSQLSEEDK